MYGKLVFSSERVQGGAEVLLLHHHSIKEKGTITKANSLFVGGLEISSNLDTETIPRLFLYNIIYK